MAAGPDDPAHVLGPIAHRVAGQGEDRRVTDKYASAILGRKVLQESPDVAMPSRATDKAVSRCASSSARRARRDARTCR
jgi:hypothetical protein